MTLLVAALLGVWRPLVAYAATVPGAPTRVFGFAEDGGAEIHWWPVPADDDGGAPISSFIIRVYSGGVLTPTVTGTGSGEIVGGLTNNVTYTFTVAAVNEAGTGPESAPSNPVVPGRRPGLPTGVVASPADRSAILSWTAPEDSGTSPVTSYYVRIFEPGERTRGVTFSGTRRR